MIRELLAEAGRRSPGKETDVHGDRALADRDHAGDLPRRRPRRTLHQPDALARHRTTSAPRRRCPPNEFAYHGALADHARLGDRRSRAPRSTSTSAPAASTSCSARPGRPRRVKVLLDGKPISAADAGTDVHDGVVDGDRPAPLQPRRPAAGRTPRARTRTRKRGCRAMPSPSASRAARARIAAMAEDSPRHRARRRRRADDRRDRRPLHGARRLRDLRAPPTAPRRCDAGRPSTGPTSSCST